MGPTSYRVCKTKPWIPGKNPDGPCESTSDMMLAEAYYHVVNWPSPIGLRIALGVGVACLAIAAIILALRQDSLVCPRCRNRRPAYHRDRAGDRPPTNHSNGLDRRPPPDPAAIFRPGSGLVDGGVGGHSGLGSGRHAQGAALNPAPTAIPGSPRHEGGPKPIHPPGLRCRTPRIRPRDPTRATTRRGLLPARPGSSGHGRTELALADFERAIELDPRLSVAYVQRGQESAPKRACTIWRSTISGTCCSFAATIQRATSAGGCACCVKGT